MKVFLAALVFLLAPRVAQACNVKVVWQADLTGDQLDPKVQTTSTGVAEFQFNFHDNLGARDATISVDLPNVKGVTSIDVRAGDRQKPGPVIFTLYTRAQGKRAGRFKVTVSEADLKRQDDPKIQTFVDVANAVMEGTAFITVSTRAHATGELRGRITMRKIPVYNTDDGAAGHDARLHEQAQAAGRKGKQPGRPTQVRN